MRASYIRVVLVVVAAAASSAALASTTPTRRLHQLVSASTCRSLVQAGGGMQRATSLLPACNPGAAYDEDACCSQAKRALRSFPAAAQCLCNADVWAEIKCEASSAGLPNVSGKRLAKFMDDCGIAYADGSGC